jgi:3-methyladenine DNA glycosylase/8-oxoguanine DNA glycosylase
MGRRRYQWPEAVEHLKGRCDRMAGFIEDFGPRRLPIRNGGNLFNALSRSIAYQQLSTKAAGTIHGRFEGLFGGDNPSAEATVEFSFDQLRGVGLSRAKTLSIFDLAEKSLAGELPTAHKMGRMSDQEIIDHLCMVRGIGPWTVQMYLIFNLGRPEVMPATDLPIQKGVQNIYRMRQLPDPAKLLKKTRHLGPYRSVASWYFWRASELPRKN